MPGDSGVLVVTRVRSITTIAHETAGAAGTRHSPRPYLGREINPQLGRTAPRDREVMFGRSHVWNWSGHRHSGAMRSIEPGISRFRVWSCGPSRNDGVWLAMTALQLKRLGCLKIESNNKPTRHART